jgi:hypothetical protein
VTLADPCNPAERVVAVSMFDARFRRQEQVPWCLSVNSRAGLLAEESTPVLEAARDLQTLAGSSVISASVADLCRQVGELPGADSDRLLAALAPEPDTADRALGELVTRVRELVTGTPT